MATATGSNKQVAYKKYTGGSNTLPTNTGAQLLRRVSCDLGLSKQTYKSNEIRTDFQIADFRHGVREVGGTLAGELSPLSYKDFFASVLRQDFQTAATTGAIVTVTAASTGTDTGTFTRSALSYLTDGFKIGDVVRWSGWTTTGTANNAINMIITALTATVMTVQTLNGSAIGAKASGDSVTCLLQGKKTWTPLTGHTDDQYAIESWHSDVTQGELFTRVKFNQVDVKLPSTGMATVDFGMMGIDIVTATSQYFTSPTAQTSSGIVAAVNGAIYVAGAKVGVITGISFTINGNMSSDAVVGSNAKPEIFEGTVEINGQFTAYFQDAIFRDLFINETEAQIYTVFTTSNLATADFLAFNFPRVKAGGATKDDGQKGIIQTIPFTALLNTTGGAAVSSLATTLSIQDSLA